MFIRETMWTHRQAPGKPQGTRRGQESRAQSRPVGTPAQPAGQVKKTADVAWDEARSVGTWITGCKARTLF